MSAAAFFFHWRRSAVLVAAVATGACVTVAADSVAGAASVSGGAIASVPTPEATPVDPLRGAGSPAAVRALAALTERQRAALAAARDADPAEVEDHRPRLQAIVREHEALVTAHPDFAAGWAAYGLFLCDPLVRDERVALALLFKANGLDPDLPVVKNQIGVLLAEQGRVLDALNYFLAASDLAPREPLYHFQIGLLLDEARDVFERSRAWTPEVVDRTVLAAFARAVELAPERTDYAYRAAEAYATLHQPRWAEAAAAWARLEERLTEDLAVQTVRLQRARALWKLGLAGDARDLVAEVDARELASQRGRLLEEFAAEERAEAARKRAESAK